MQRGGPRDRAALEVALRAAARDVHEWSSAPGDRFAMHEHAYTKILYCVSGSIVFTLSDGTSLALSAGDRLTLPAGTRHGAAVGGQGCTCVEGKG